MFCPRVAFVLFGAVAQRPSWPSADNVPSASARTNGNGGSGEGWNMPAGGAVVLLKPCELVDRMNQPSDVGLSGGTDHAADPAPWRGGNLRLLGLTASLDE